MPFSLAQPPHTSRKGKASTMQVRITKPLSLKWMVVVFSVLAGAAQPADAQSRQPPLPPELPNNYYHATSTQEPTRTNAGPEFHISDVGDDPSSSKNAAPRASAEVAIRPPLTALPGESVTPPPVVDSLSAYLHQQGAEEVRQLRSLRSDLGELNKIIEQRKRREQEALETAAEARRRELLAQESARAAERQKWKLELERQEVQRLMRELEQRELEAHQRQQESAAIADQQGPPRLPASTTPPVSSELLRRIDMIA